MSHPERPLPELRRPTRAPTLGEAFDPRRNALNAIRLLLAISVIGWHSFPLTGADVTYAPLKQLLSHVGVDGFFTISGYLIVSSWLRSPRTATFLWARVLRIFPGFWVSLLVTALVIAPLTQLARGAALDGRFWGDAFSYLSHNFLLWVGQYDIAGTPAGVPYPGVWNGSMWTLMWEFFCYLAVLALGLLGILARRSTVLIAFVLLTLTTVATSYGPIDNYWLTLGSRFGLPFVAGALIHHYQDRIALRGRYLLIAAAVVLLACLLPDYRVVAALPLAYLMLGLGALGRHERLRLREDLSYGTYIYAFPLQQVLALTGAGRLGVGVFALLALALTLPVAAASWFGVEKPALRLKHLVRGRTREPAPLTK